jgi:PAS domain-containing protein
MRRFDGTYRWFLFRANPLRDESGNIVKWYGTNVDIEDRKRSQEALRESEQRFRLIVDGIAGLVAIMSPTGEVEVVNHQFLTYFGKAVGQLKGWSTRNAVHPDDMHAVASAWTRSVETATLYDIDHACCVPMANIDGSTRAASRCATLKVTSSAGMFC